METTKLPTSQNTYTKNFHIAKISKQQKMTYTILSQRRQHKMSKILAATVVSVAAGTQQNGILATTNALDLQYKSSRRGSPSKKNSWGDDDGPLVDLVPDSPPLGSRKKGTRRDRVKD